jgi:hypothetical protein
VDIEFRVDVDTRPADGGEVGLVGVIDSILILGSEIRDMTSYLGGQYIQRVLESISSRVDSFISKARHKYYAQAASWGSLMLLCN